jgi:transposase
VLVNQIRGLLSERGIVINLGISQIREQLPLILEDAENGLTALSRELFAEQYEKLNPYLTSFPEFRPQT